jgi:hypothetical protein
VIALDLFIPTFSLYLFRKLPLKVSRGISIDKIVADSCYVSVIGICQFINKSSDGPDFYAANIHIGSIYSTNSSSWPLQISVMEGFTIETITVDGTVLIENDAANIHIVSLAANGINFPFGQNKYLVVNLFIQNSLW